MSKKLAYYIKLNALKQIPKILRSNNTYIYLSKKLQFEVKNADF